MKSWSSEFVTTHYPSDLTDSQWELASSFFPQGPNSGHHKCSLVNAVLYLVNNGCKWRAPPHDFPPWPTVSSFYRRARLRGLWKRVSQSVVQKSRLNAGRAASPSYAIVD